MIPAEIEAAMHELREAMIAMQMAAERLNDALDRAVAAFKTLEE